MDERSVELELNLKNLRKYELCEEVRISWSLKLPPTG